MGSKDCTLACYACNCSCSGTGKENCADCTMCSPSDEHSRKG